MIKGMGHATAGIKDIDALADFVGLGIAHLVGILLSVGGYLIIWGSLLELYIERKPLRSLWLSGANLFSSPSQVNDPTEAESSGRLESLAQVSFKNL